MPEPAIDLSEIVGMYKEDARQAVEQMRGALNSWSEVIQGGPARQQLRKISHQLRGSGRTYGFRNVSRIAKALEKSMIKLQENRLSADERLQKSMLHHIEQLATIFK